MSTTARLPRYQRVPNPPSMRLTARDRCILESIHAYDGMLGFSQIQRMFFSGKSQAELRLMLLYQHRYLNRPNQVQRRRVPEMIYWLDQRGAKLIASLFSCDLSNFKWRKNPRWFQVEHDLAVNDFRLDVVEACDRSQDVSLEDWIPESEFWSYPDRISYTNQGKTIKRNIRPDGFFILRTKTHRLRCLLEIDRSTEDNPRFLREKITPGLAYIKTKTYETRFGHRSGKWLVVTTSQRRLNNMLRQAKRGNAGNIFLFTTYDQISPHSLFFEPIWKSAAREEMFPLINPTITSKD